jgi:hypothetical protein
MDSTAGPLRSGRDDKLKVGASTFRSLLGWTEQQISPLRYRFGREGKLKGCGFPRLQLVV